MKNAAITPRIYRLMWNGHRQIMWNINKIDQFELIKSYIKNAIDSGTAKLYQFEIFDQFGQLRTNIINEPDADPTLIKNYYKVF